MDVKEMSTEALCQEAERVIIQMIRIANRAAIRIDPMLHRYQVCINELARRQVAGQQIVILGEPLSHHDLAEMLIGIPEELTNLIDWRGQRLLQVGYLN